MIIKKFFLAVKISGNDKEDLCKVAGVRTAIFAALSQGVEADFLTKFCEVVNKGFSDASIESTPAIVLAKYLRNNKGKHGGTKMNEECQVTEMAIRDSYAGIPRKQMYKKFKSIYIKKQ